MLSSRPNTTTVLAIVVEIAFLVRSKIEHNLAGIHLRQMMRCLDTECPVQHATTLAHPHRP